MSLSVVILAAGKSTRFRSAVPKVLHTFGERPMIQYNLDLAAGLSDLPPVLVVGEETEAPLRAWAGDQVRYVYQAQRLGTGHAVLQARELLHGTADQVLVLYGDMPLLRLATLQQLVHLQAERHAALAMVTVVRDESQGFGRVLRDSEGRVIGVVEEPEATAEQLAIREYNAGIYVYDADFLWNTLPLVRPSATKGEIYLTDMVELASRQGRLVADLIVEDVTEAMGINTRADLADALAVMRRRINLDWMLAGVTLVDPSTAYIGPDVRIGTDTTILPNTHLRGKTIIGQSCKIGPNAVLESSTVGDRCTVIASVLEYAEMEHDSEIGPFSHLRKGARICTGAHVGNFGELKNSTLGPGAKMGHFSYLGDATVGANANIGAGTITCNFDGVNKHPTEIGDDAFIGSDSLLVAPVRVGRGAKTGAGSVVTHDVPDDTLVYGVPARPRGGQAATRSGSEGGQTPSAESSADEDAPASPNALIAAATKAIDDAYAPYSHYPVAAAVLGADGNIYTGCNIENAVYPVTICAERVAIFKAVAAGVHRILALAVVTANAGAPCGSCRQVMREFAGDEMPIYIADRDGAYRVQSLGALLPDSFSAQDLADSSRLPDPPQGNQAQ